MIVVVLENPEPSDPVRCGVDIEVRIMIKGATFNEASLIGDALNQLAKLIRPTQELKAFQINESQAT